MVAGRGVPRDAWGGGERRFGSDQASRRYMAQQAALCGLGSIFVFLLSAIDSSLTVTNDRYLKGGSALQQLVVRVSCAGERRGDPSARTRRDPRGARH